MAICCRRSCLGVRITVRMRSRGGEVRADARQVRDLRVGDVERLQDLALSGLQLHLPTRSRLLDGHLDLIALLHTLDTAVITFLLEASCCPLGASTKSAVAASVSVLREPVSLADRTDFSPEHSLALLLVVHALSTRS